MDSRIMVKQILSQLDQTWGIMGMFSGNMDRAYPIEWRLTARRSGDRWAIIIERSTYSPAGVRHSKSVHGGIITGAVFWGNCLSYEWKPVPKPLILRVTSDPVSGPSFVKTDDDPHPHVNVNVAALLIRDQPVPVCIDPEAYGEMGIVLHDYPRIRPFECLRALSRPHRSGGRGFAGDAAACGPGRAVARPSLGPKWGSMCNVKR